MSVRVRYAPSPTGLQHIGGVRTSLYNYFFAKAMGGVFFVRIEDTDQGRFDPRALDDIYQTFEWLGIKPDEGPREGGPFGPYVQSERIALYQSEIQKLLAGGHAYRCFCTSETLDAMRKEQEASGQPQGYDRRCRNLDPAEAEKRAASGERHVIRFKVPLEGETIVHDILRGEVVWPNRDINPDPVLIKADGFPTYHFAHVVDDFAMKTTHVLRGQEWLPSAPLHVLIFKAFGYPVPEYCHLSVILGPDGSKLSKRHGATSALEFRQQGYLADAIINYITLLGWSYDGERELFSRQDLEKLFTLEKLSKSPAIFDFQKLEHFNAHWLREKSDHDLAALVLPKLVEAGLVTESAEVVGRIESAMPIARERLHKLQDSVDVLSFLFRAPPLDDVSRYIPKKMDAAGVVSALELLLPTLAEFPSRNDEENDAWYHAFIEGKGLKIGQVLMPLRLAITGTSASPPLMASIRLVGLEEATRRIKAVMDFLKK